MNTDINPSSKPPGPPSQPFITHPGQILDTLLKQPIVLISQLQRPGTNWIALTLGVVAFLALAAYGLVVGSLSGGSQLWAASSKIAVGTLVSVLICLPSLYIFACLNGLEAGLRQIAGVLAAAICLSAILLIGFAPVAWIFSQSTDSIVLMGTMHLIFWCIGLGFGLRLLKTLANPTQGKGHLRIWTVIFVLVCLQMTTALRPIIGTAPTVLPTEKQFFVVHWFNSIFKPAATSQSSKNVF